MKFGTGKIFHRLDQQRELGVLLLLVLTVAIVSIRDSNFLLLGNIRDMLVGAAPTLIIGCGMTLVIVTGEIDISVGSLMGLCAAVMGQLTSTTDGRLGLPVWVGVAAMLSLGALVGLINGLLVTVGRVPSIIVTLGMLTALRGITQRVIGPTWIQDMPPGLRYFGTGTIFGIPVSVLTAIVVVVGFIIMTRQTPLGRRIYAVGSNVRSAHLAGISQTRIKLAVFIITGILTAIATLVSATQLQVIDPGFGKSRELLIVTCVVVGGTSISGGRGTIIGSALGALLLSIVGTVLIFMKLGPSASYWERAIHGAFILLAVLADHLAPESSSEAHA
ncbi:MAG TPA: ABC transporter permease [Tepidisphaeraceae bacterium]|nr:ABC transporter permease [Tepidisphaeraceae bacterium]